jgi:hypothetical protein
MAAIWVGRRGEGFKQHCGVDHLMNLKGKVGRRALSVKVAATTSMRKESAIELCLMPYGTDVTNVGAPIKTNTNGCES